MNTIKMSVLAVIVLAMTTFTHAGIIQIQLGGVDISYSGNTVVDAGSEDPDTLTNATFLDDGVLLGVDTTGVTLDLYIPGVINIPVGGGQVSTAVAGSLDLDLDDGEFLLLTLDSTTVTYLPLTSTVNFVFIGSVASIDGQELPYELSLFPPVSVSFSTQLVQPASESDGFVSAFVSAGTGEIQGVPEPATLALLAVGGLAMLRRKS